MSTPEQPSSDSNVVDSESTSSAEKKSRSPIEKIVVWGLILGLGGIAGFEALTRYGHQKAFDAVDAAYREGKSKDSAGAAD